MKLSIIILFCDKDYFLLPNLLNSIELKVKCSHELILVDNRETNNDKLDFGSDIKIIKKGRNLAQLTSKVLATSISVGDYIWFVDADDNLNEIITQDDLDRVSGDIIVFNYINIVDSNAGPCPLVSSSYKKQKLFFRRTHTLISKISSVCWNKWFKRNILTSIFMNIDDDALSKKVSFMEDNFIVQSMVANSSSIEYLPKCFYVFNGDKSFSAGKSLKLQGFETVIQGFDTTMSLLHSKRLKRFFKNQRVNGVYYVVQRLLATEELSWKDALEKVYQEHITQQELISALGSEQLSYLDHTLRDRLLECILLSKTSF